MAKRKLSQGEKKIPVSSSGRKKVVNPFVFLLAKRFVDYGFVGVDDEPSDLQFVRYIYDRHKEPGYQNTSYTDSPLERDGLAFSKAESLRKNILKQKGTFLFTTKSLDKLVEEIRYPFYTFTSWNDFEKRFNDHPAYKAAQLRLWEKQVFTKEEVKQFLAYANKELYEHHMYLVHSDLKNNPFYSFHNNSFVTRNANAKEIELIEEIETRRAFLSKNLFAFFKSYTLLNFKPIFIHKDIYDNPIAYFLLFPLKEGIYEKIKSGKQFIDFLSPTDFVQHSQNEKIRYFYFYLVYNKEIQTIFQGNAIKTLETGMQALFYNLAELFDDELTFGTIVEDEKSAGVIKKLGFKRKECESDKSNFYELNWTAVETKRTYLKIALQLDIYTLFPFRNPYM